MLYYKLAPQTRRRHPSERLPTFSDGQQSSEQPAPESSISPSLRCRAKLQNTSPATGAACQGPGTVLHLLVFRMRAQRLHVILRRHGCTLGPFRHTPASLRPHPPRRAHLFFILGVRRSTGLLLALAHGSVTVLACTAPAAKTWL